jgi:hypothetical protein
VAEAVEAAYLLSTKHIRSTVDFDTLEGHAVIHAAVGGIVFVFH